MKVLISIMVIFLISLSSCKKYDQPAYDGINCSGNCFILIGQIIDTPTTAKLSDVELKFYLSPREMLSRPEYLGVTKTNSNGEYKFQFDATNFTDSNSHNLFYITHNMTEYFCFEPTSTKAGYFNLTSSNVNIPFIQNFTFFKKAKLKVHFKSQQIFPYDFFDFMYGFGKTNFGIAFNGHRYIDTTITFITAGDIRAFINWGPGYYGSNMHYDTIIIPTSSEQIYNVNP
ncbi:MAG: hypothetical protein A2033_17945 [Bacteroidetes bacterium GWA2_31_9]|nr:MAG: hypothetical protein A2033_17945 [Bacteroidetes bacterium GWA2_31_9]